ncbi:head-tail adaptor protein [Roseivivax sediminis]|uniref:Head-tail adaptor n=1 Tax=Roseivivax sediminis TaxID=936889 RepID=A0A1I1T5N9_9RHOB|nr:head-tail adaptor protein [Roseivivax sediminis]SFD53944.1 head-tail adaptor [Roseivivax sediminis]
MSAPRLTCELTLEAPQKLPDGAGGFAETWQALGTLWGAVEARSGRDGGSAGGPVALTSYRIIVRGAPMGDPARPAPGQRFVFETRRFVIEAVAERDPAGRYLTCFAEEEIAA